jgi:urease accessory protein
MLAATMAAAAAATPQAAGRGDIVVRAPRDASVVTRTFASSPLRLLNPSNHGRAAWIYTSTFGGGLVDGDDIRIAIDVGPGAAAYLSTQSATKVYRSPGGTASDVHATIDRGGLLVVAPDPIVPFTGARFRQTQRYDLADDAGLVFVDVLTCGRRASGERWGFAAFESRLEVRIDGCLRILDVLSLREADGDLARRCGRFDVIATAVVAGASLSADVTRLTTAAATPVAPRADVVAAVSPIGDAACLVRLAGTTTEMVWRTLRRLLDFVPMRLGDDPWRRKW